jgi:hypothetical protein
MADPQLHRLLSSLEATFEAAVTRQEEEAASDLAVSLRQDQTLQETLLRSGPVRLLLDGAHAVAVSVVGEDYVVAGDPPRLMQSRAAAFVTGGEGNPPRRSRTSMLTLLRTWARSRATVDVLVDGRPYRGVLVQATAQHLTVEAAAGRLYVGADVLTEVRLVSGGSTGDL